MAGKSPDQANVIWLSVNQAALWLSKHGRLPDGALSRSSAFDFKAESLRPISDYAIRAFYDFAKNPEFFTNE